MHVCCSARIPAVHIDQYLIYGTHMMLSSKPAARYCCCKLMGHIQMDGHHYIDPALNTVQAISTAVEFFIL